MEEMLIKPSMQITENENKMETVVCAKKVPSTEHVTEDIANKDPMNDINAKADEFLRDSQALLNEIDMVTQEELNTNDHLNELELNDAEPNNLQVVTPHELPDQNSEIVQEVNPLREINTTDTTIQPVAKEEIPQNEITKPGNATSPIDTMEQIRAIGRQLQEKGASHLLKKNDNLVVMPKANVSSVQSIKTNPQKETSKLIEPCKLLPI